MGGLQEEAEGAEGRTSLRLVLGVEVEVEAVEGEEVLLLQELWMRVHLALEESNSKEKVNKNDGLYSV